MRYENCDTITYSIEDFNILRYIKSTPIVEMTGTLSRFLPNDKSRADSHPQGVY
jgi:hypothetical protein